MYCRRSKKQTRKANGAIKICNTSEIQAKCTLKKYFVNSGRIDKFRDVF